MSIKKLVTIIGLLILPITIFLYYIVTSDYSFTVLSEPQPNSVINTRYFKELLANQKIKINFTSPEPNLALVGLRFNTFNRENDDQIIFKLKEKGAKNWYFTQIYRTTLVNGVIYNFGFVPITNSKEKIYSIELTSLKGKPGNAVALDNTYPSLITKHKFSKHELLSDKHLLMTFITKKIAYMIQDRSILLSIIVSFLPLLYYVFSNFLFKKYSNYLYRLCLLLICIIIFIDIYFIKSSSNIIYLLIILLWLMIYKSSRRFIDSTFLIGLFFLSLTMILSIITGEEKVIKTAGWAILFLSCGLLVSIINMKGLSKKK